MKNNLCLSILMVLMLFMGTSTARAQAFDGPDDYKIKLGGIAYGKNLGIELSYTNGLSDFISYGVYGRLVQNAKKKGEDSEALEDAMLDLGVELGYHFTEVVHWNSRFDAEAGVNLGIFGVGPYVGCRYNFGEVIGVYAQTGYNVFSILKTEHENLFNKKLHFNVGLSISI